MSHKTHITHTRTINSLKNFLLAFTVTKKTQSKKLLSCIYILKTRFQTAMLFSSFKLYIPKQNRNSPSKNYQI